ncbi:hypothetical protein L1987_79294 [Smallanthus sonchifolius]|uniref:Uncharacterized protein n=1 Tax=Smallanthus sonchifolius TaxID=185202 RepID=A0ACB8ZFC7_9ASTR|nr:hypothetical protein L1987_79294 [Smallanthus sonchifolius]
MCENCSCSTNYDLFSKAKKIGFEEGEVCVKCSCCGVDFEKRRFDDSAYFVINPSWDFLGFKENGDSVVDLIGSDTGSGEFGEKDEVQFQGKETEETEYLIQIEKGGELNYDTPTQDLEFLLDCSGNQLVPVESIDPIEENLQDNLEVDEDQEFGDFQKATEKADELSKFAELDSMEFEETENSLVFHANFDEKSVICEETQTQSDSKEDQETEGGDSDHDEADVSIGTEIPVLDSCDEIKAQDNFNLYSLSHEEPSSSSHDLDFSLEYGLQEAREGEKTEESKNLNQQEDTLLLIEKNDSMVDESFDESEMEGGDPVNTIEKLKLSLRAERKALQAVLDSCDGIKAQDLLNLSSLSHEEPSPSSHDLDFSLEYGFQEAREGEKTEKLKNLNRQEDTLLGIERKDSMVDESFDGSEIEGGDPVNTIEKFKLSLRAERKALQAVLDSCDETKAQDHFNLYSLSREEPLSSSHDLDFNLEYGFQEAREGEKTEELKNLNQQEDTLLMIERKDSMVDESFDGSEMEGGDPVNTTEKLKSALRAERKALQALYTELEEERSASAVAANETMAMINRLQEEKAAMQMEALHYQRMMEEQSEYDQEALQLLNELMVKKEKELEMYRKKVLDYETKERMRFLTSSVKSGTCSASCSHSEDGDGMWVNANHEPKEEEISNGNQEIRNGNQIPPVDTIMNLDSSFVDFEDERMSILEQLKVLEEKLFTLSDEEDQHFADLRQIEDYFEENGKHLNGINGYDGQEVNGITRYQDRRVVGSTGKRLLPLFDALETESDDGMITSNGNGNGFHSDKVENTAVTRFELQKKRIDIEEEVDQLYIRLQALEADREFLKHCIGSLKKGDKGMELLQEILQHLRDLRNVDLREKSFTDGTLV